MAAPFAYTAATGGKRERGRSKRILKNRNATRRLLPKQDYNKSWTEAAGLKSLHA
jgi:hypothetical protein